VNASSDALIGSLDQHLVLQGRRFLSRPLAGVSGIRRLILSVCDLPERRSIERPGLVFLRLIGAWDGATRLLVGRSDSNSLAPVRFHEPLRTANGNSCGSVMDWNAGACHRHMTSGTRVGRSVLKRRSGFLNGRIWPGEDPRNCVRRWMLRPDCWRVERCGYAGSRRHHVVVSELARALTR
jgi:hypothetical protein